jgi:hypothetical protein
MGDLLYPVYPVQIMVKLIETVFILDKCGDEDEGG